MTPDKFPETLENDIFCDEYARKSGFVVFRFKECDILKTGGSCFDTLKKEINVARKHVNGRTQSTQEKS